MSDKPSKTYVEIGHIEVYAGGDSILIARQEASKRGAHAIIYIGSQAYGHVSVPPNVEGGKKRDIVELLQAGFRGDVN